MKRIAIAAVVALVGILVTGRTVNLVHARQLACLHAASETPADTARMPFV